MSSKKHKEAVRRVGLDNVALERGIFSPSYDRAATSALVGKAMRQQKRGLFDPNRDKSAGGKTTAAIHHARGTGLHNPMMSKFAMHKQWHINRGVANPECELCVAGIESFSELK